MSWQSYIDDQLLASGFCYAAIVDFKGTPWASSPGYIILPDEAKKISTLLGGSSFDSITSEGFTMAGVKYAFTRGEVDDDEGGVPFLQGRCKEAGKSSQGVIIMRCNTCLVVGVHEPKHSNGRSFGQVNTDMGRLADYLMENGF